MHWGIVRAVATVAVFVSGVAIWQPLASSADPAPIAFRSASSGFNATTTSLTIAKPAGVIAGDVMVASISARGNPNFVAPAGWAPIRLDVAGNVVRSAAYYRVATGSEGPSFTWTWSGIQNAAGGILAYSGVDTTTPVDAHSGAASTSASSSIVAPPVTSTVAGTMLVGLFATAQNATIVPPVGMSERFEALSSAGKYPVTAEAAEQSQAEPGSSGSRSAAASRNARNVGQLVALRPTAPPPSPSPSPSPTSTPTPPTGDPVIAAAGDIACDPDHAKFLNGEGTASECRQRHTSDLLVGSGYAAVLPVGDLQYEVGSLEDFGLSYDPSWGRVKASTRPVPGNHEYLTPGAAGYYDYFGAAAGDRTKGYYSYDIGAWHIIALNSNCLDVACGPGSAQELWLREDLRAHPNQCTMAYWHHPLFSSAGKSDSSVRPLWEALYDFNADVVITGHDHAYERFAPQTATGVADPVRGIRQFITGMGGRSHDSAGNLLANSQVRNNTTFGILELTLQDAGYAWRFAAEAAGPAFADSGSASCNGGPPPASAAPTAEATSWTTPEDSAIAVTLRAHDAESCELRFQIAVQPAHGSVSAPSSLPCSAGTPNTDTSRATYTPVANYNGPDSFGYRVVDASGASSVVTTVSLTVTPAPDPPVAAADGYATAPAQTLAVGPPGVLLNDTDADGDPLTAVLATPPANGTLDLNANGSFTYTPSTGFSGDDSFTYRAFDGAASSAPATVTIAVSGGPPPITFRSSAYGVVGSGNALTILRPPVLAAGDVMIASIDARGNPSFVAPAGWTLVRLDISGFVQRKATYFKVATAAEPDFYTWTWSAPQSAAGGIVAYANVDQAAPIAAHSGAASANSTSASIRAPSVSTTQPGAMILGFFAMAHNATIAPPATMSERFDAAANTGPYPVTSEGADMAQAEAGATGDLFATSSRTGWSIGQLIALRRAPGP